jgi:BirA family biotin operon repressor/biotin-[acetyl-CoA-carboxylase] ligase
MEFDIRSFKTIDSTQDEIMRRYRVSARPGTVVISDVQTKGRGRGARPWDSEDGNLAASLLWHAAGAGHQSPIVSDISLIVAVALHRAVASFLDNPIALRIKWPNDLILGNMKCAGILIERPDPEWFVIGTGVNIKTAAEGACQNGRCDKGCADRAGTFGSLFVHFTQVMETYQAQGLAPIRAAWMDRAYGVGQPMSIRLPMTRLRPDLKDWPTMGPVLPACRIKAYVM